MNIVAWYCYISHRISSLSRSNISGKFLSLYFLCTRQSERVHLLLLITYLSVIGDKCSKYVIFLSLIFCVIKYMNYQWLLTSYRGFVDEKFSNVSVQQGSIFGHLVLKFLLTLVRIVLELKRGWTGLLFAAFNLVKNLVYKYRQKGEKLPTWQKALCGGCVC